MPTLSRRTFLRGSGVAVALPLLDAMVPAFGATPKVVRRLVGCQTNMGILPQFFFPEKAGKDYVATPYLEKLAAHRNNMTVFSGVSLPGVTGGHAADRCYLSMSPRLRFSHPQRRLAALEQASALEGPIGNYPDAAPHIPHRSTATARNSSRRVGLLHR